jgi:two-component system sensor histidine kinase HydH
MRAVSYSRLLQLSGVCLAICLVAIPHHLAHLSHLVGHEMRPAFYISAAVMGIALVVLGFLRTDYTLRDVVQLLAICLGLCSISICHYVISPDDVHWHEILQRAYYLPIVFAALWYGSTGGVLTAVLAAVLYIPHILSAWGAQPNYQFNQYAEVALFFVFGGLTGVLADRQRNQRIELQESAQKLTKAYNDLQQSFESLRRAERLSALGTLSAALAHEIRSPLSAIEGAVEIVGRTNLSAEQRCEFTAVIKRELERLNGLLYQFLEFAQPRPLVHRRTDIQQLANDVCNLVAEMAYTKKIAVVRPETEIALPKVDIDPDQIKEVILNLVMNACEAMPEGGKVELFLEKKLDQIILGVRDQGIGIAQEDLQRIFDPFYTTKNDGTGLGLSIAQRIMEQHGGRIEAERNPERGMTFTLLFPLRNGGA